MPLSADEQRRFEELVGRLDDPDHRRARRALGAGVASLVAGFALVVASFSVMLWVAVLAYGIMLGSALVAESALRILQPRWWQRVAERAGQARLRLPRRR
ncbi:MAG: hypothetical protein ACRD0F_09425 [Acidimicrobiales bacterium]